MFTLRTKHELTHIYTYIHMCISHAIVCIAIYYVNFPRKWIHAQVVSYGRRTALRAFAENEVSRTSQTVYNNNNNNNGKQKMQQPSPDNILLSVLEAKRTSSLLMFTTYIYCGRRWFFADLLLYWWVAFYMRLCMTYALPLCCAKPIVWCFLVCINEPFAFSYTKTRCNLCIVHIQRKRPLTLDIANVALCFSNYIILYCNDQRHSRNHNIK